MHFSKQKDQKGSSNNLVNRLYVSHNPRHRPVHPVLGRLAFEGVNTSFQDRALVPRIARSKLKPLEQDRRLRNKLFSKQDSLLEQEQSFSRSILNTSQIKSPLTKVRSKMHSQLQLEAILGRQESKLELKSDRNEERKLLTPQDFMQILKIDRDMSEQFCYMNKGTHAYDWHIVEFDEKNAKQYMVISKRGLTKYLNSEIEFMRFEQFVEEQTLFLKLARIDYFNLFSRKKYFQTWKKYTSAVIFKERSKEFGEKTLLCDDQIKETFIEAHKICQKIEKTQTFYCQSIIAMPLDEFKLYTQNQRLKAYQRLEEGEHLLLEELRKKIALSMATYLKKMRINKDSVNEKMGLNDRKVPLLIGDESGKDMPYTESATIRTHQQRIRNLLKMVDYLVITAKTELSLNMVDFLCETLRDINATYADSKQVFSSSSWLETSLLEVDGTLVFDPPSYGADMEEILFGTVDMICEKHFQFLHLAQFDEYWSSKSGAQKMDERVDIKVIIQTNLLFNDKVMEFKQELRKSYDNLLDYSNIFNPSLQFIRYARELEAVDFKTQNGQFFRDIMNRCRMEMKSFGEIQTIKEVGLISLNAKLYKQKIEHLYQQVTSRVHREVPGLLHDRSKALLDGIHDNYQLIGYNPLTIQEYIAFLSNTTRVTKFSEETQPIIGDNSMLLTLSEAYSIKISDSTRNLLGQANGQMIGLSRRLSEIQKTATQFADKFKKQIERLIPTFKQRIKNHSEKLAEAQLLKNNETASKKKQKLAELRETLWMILNEKNEFSGYQEQLGYEVTDFPEIDTYEHNFKNIEALFEERKKWEEFHMGILRKETSTIAFAESKKQLESISKKITVLLRQLEPNEAIQSLKQSVDTFKPLFYAVEATQSISLEEKHRQEMRQHVRNRFEGRQSPRSLQVLLTATEAHMQNFEYFLSFEVNFLKEEFVEIAVQAEKEFYLLEMTGKVEGSWKTLTFVTIPFRDGKEGYIMGNNEELISRIDDNLMTVNNVLASKYVAPIKSRVQLQAKMLRYMQELIDQWYLHQKNWIYLEPILKSSFALKNLPKETALFTQIDNKWKIIMKQARDQLNIKRYADEHSSSYTLKLLKNNNESFEIIQKTLENFLQKKRDLFQRFYFLSNDELLQILSTVKNPEQIEPHLKKVFQNFLKITFDTKGVPETMGSAQGEIVLLRNCVFRGEIEEWFKSAEESMRATLKSIVRQGITKYTEQGLKRPAWIKLFPSQIVLVVDCIMWTLITEGYLQNIQENDLSEWHKTNVSQLNELVELIRTDLSPLERKTLVALITQDVHFRDITEALQTCESISDFKWIQQLRFYSVNENVVAKQVQAQLAYGYEYLGATTRLVITPLTDRCWMTITGALHIKLGANPAGPAGTGKTQSCKDLAKSLGRYCIVFNCSDQINALMMEKLFSGLAYTGSWTCLDQFNRIDIEVLSVIAQQVLTIRQSLLQGKSLKQFVFGGKTINLNHDLGIFITMNPGYAGRTELPDNLKTLFRPISMMVPDYTLIAEIMLFSEGFTSAKELSRKMTKLYRLSSQQLSQQNHYDFGMRAVKSVLVMAGGLKRAEPSLSEQIIIIRAMQDSNLPKFLAHDIPLFNSLIQDLFPFQKIAKRNQQETIQRVKNNCIAANLIATSLFVEKCLQLCQTMKVRFGTMLVGPPMGSKSSIVRMLLGAFPLVINPKAVSLAELYGNFDTLTQTWTDGLASKLLRQSVESKEYVMFDGPVDAIWVENLNTVLDDSMMLCLSNGERIKLNPQMRILFEVEDLNQASPATVSRCGMVWVSEEVINWEQLVNSFFTQHRLLNQQQKMTFITNLIKSSFKKGYMYITKFAKQMVKINLSTLAASYCKSVKNMFGLLTEDIIEADSWRKSFQKICVYAYVWSVGAILSEDSKSKLDKNLSELFSADSLKSPIVNFTLSFKDKPEGEWISWSMILPEFQFPQGLDYMDIFVPTKEVFCYSSVMSRFIENMDPIFLTAPTGTGKSSLIEQLIRKSNQVGFTFTFTAQTSPAIAQTQFESKLQSQRKLGSITLIPPPGKQFLYFVDDINMPVVEQYGAQPPVEMLRLLLGNCGVWDRKTFVFKHVDGVEVIIAGTHGRTELPPRFLRFFNSFYMSELEEDSIVLIFSELTKGYFQQMKLKRETIELIFNKSIVNATLSLYMMIRLELLPSPEKCHYLFNLRDVSRVFQGLVIAKQAALPSPEALARLWAHEFERVFADRLTNEKDKAFVREEIGKKVVVTLKCNISPESLFQGPLLWCNFLRRGGERKDLVYEEVKDYSKVLKILSDCMSDETNMSLVLFSDAVAHVTRVSRALQFQKGHIILIGLSGSGKQSMISLGCTVNQCQIRSVQPRKNYGRVEFREDLFRAMKVAAIQDKQTCFVFPENQMLDDSFLEDINNFLSNGQVPCMFTKQQQEEINQIGPEGFLKKILTNLHVALTLSPVGSQFRTRIRNFPSLINCCFIDWVSKWPQEALINVANIRLEQNAVAEACVTAHQQIEKLAQAYFIATRRRVFVTAKNYITLIDTFNYVLTATNTKLQSKMGKLSSGVHKLEQANSIIQDLKDKLIKMQPILQEKTIEQENLLRKLEVDREEAGQVKEVVEKEQKIISEKAEHAMEEKKQADRILNEALPALHAANEALNTLNRNDISEIKMNQNPHLQVRFTLESVSILLQQKQDWETVRKTISDINFITRLKNLDVYHIPPKVESVIKAKLKTNPLFKPNQIKQINFAAKSLCEWVLAVVSFHEVNKQIVKKKQIVKELNKELQIASKELQLKRNQLGQIVGKVKGLETLFLQSKEQKEKLHSEIALTKRRLLNAEALTDGFKNEKNRWAQTLVELYEDERNLIGNTFLSACCLSYWGPYSSKFREEYMQSIIAKVDSMHIPKNPSYSLPTALGDSLEIAEWINQGLPKDFTSICNAVLANQTLQHPLLIDPQMQANRWIKSVLKKDSGVYLKAGSNGILNALQNALLLRYPIMIELNEPSIDPSLSNLLSKDYEVVNKRWFVKLGDKKVELERDQLVYVLIKSANPAFTPEVFIKLCVINFTVTPTGLEDQLLADVVEHELPEIELKKRELVQVISKGRITLAKNEDKILSLLTNSQGLILDDVELIANLKESKKVSGEVKTGLQDSVVKSIAIEQARSFYQPVAARGAVLYLAVSDLAKIEIMYLFSLEYYSRIFAGVLANTQIYQDRFIRIRKLNENLTKTVFTNISRGLFNQHKRLFAFILATRLGNVPKVEYDYFLKGNFSLPSNQQIVETIPGLSLEASVSLAKLKLVFQNSIYEYFLRDQTKLEVYFADPLQFFSSEDYLQDQIGLTLFQRLIVIKVLSPEFVLQLMGEFIRFHLGSEYLDSTSPSMAVAFKDTVKKVPLTFILSPGADPLQQLLRFAKQYNKPAEEIHIISLGQGQGPPTLLALEKATLEGHWVILQNCHLGKSFLPALDLKIQEINESLEVHQSFRLFMTCMPCDYFPAAILQSSLKVTAEPPKGIKANIRKMLGMVKGDTPTQQIMAFHLCIFHAIVLERRKFGSLGWNIRYDFNESDLETSLTIVTNLIHSSEEVPHDAIQYFVGEIVYGGRVTDQFDRRLLKTLLQDFVSFESLEKPKCVPGEQLNFIESLPQMDHPSMFGLNSNSQKTYMLKMTTETLENLLRLEPLQVSSTDNTKLISLLNDVVARIPPQMRKNEEKKNPDAIDICLAQQSLRFNRLLGVIDTNLKELLQAMKGVAIMTEPLENILTSLSLNQVPNEWEKKAYPSIKPFAFWFQDLLERVKFLRQSLIQKPRSYWISALFFPQGFFTSVLQMFARKTRLPVDSLSFSFICKQYDEKQLPDASPVDGCFVHGLYSEASCIDFKTGIIKDSPLNVLDSEVPVIHFKPLQTAKNQINYNTYEMPLYKTKKRAGVLSTTGHSTNYVISVLCKSEQEESYWIKRGAALFCSL